MSTPAPEPENGDQATTWVVYVLVSEPRGRTYVGVATEPLRRLRQHNGELVGGARATRAGRPWTLGAVYGPYAGRADAQRAEAALKRLAGRARLSWSAPRLPLPAGSPRQPE